MFDPAEYCATLAALPIFVLLACVATDSDHAPELRLQALITLVLGWIIALALN